MPEATGASCRLPGSPEAERSCTEQSRVRGLRTRDRERGRRGRGRRTVCSQPCSGLASVALHSSAGAVPRAQSPLPSPMRMPPQLWAPGTPSSGCCLRGGHRKPLPDARGGGGTDGSEAEQGRAAWSRRPLSQRRGVRWGLAAWPMRPPGWGCPAQDRDWPLLSAPSRDPAPSFWLVTPPCLPASSPCLL